MSTSRNRSVRLTHRDDFVLDHIIRVQAVTAPILRSSLLPLHSRTGIYTILNRLTKAGMLEDLKTGQSNRARPIDVPALFVPTKAAHEYRGSPLSARPVSVSRVHHTLAVAQVGLTRLRAGDAVITDREMQQQRAAAKHNPTGSAAASPTWLETRYATHVPDLIVTAPNGTPWAIEVELTRKSKGALGRVLDMYARTQKYQIVVYVVPNHAMAKHITSAWNSIGLSHGSVTLHTWVLPPVPPMT